MTNDIILMILRDTQLTHSIAISFEYRLSKCEFRIIEYCIAMPFTTRNDKRAITH